MYPIERKIIIILVAFLTFNFLIAGNAAANAITVSNSTDRAANFTSIQDAVNAASPGDEIIVKPGIYTENIEITIPLTILSESGNPSDTIIQAANTSRNVFGVWANEVNINGLTIRGSSSASGIHFFGAGNCLIKHNNLSNNNCGINLYMFSSGNILIGNNVSESLTGISLSGSLDNDVRENSVSYCNCGISLFDSLNNTLESNIISENGEGISLTGESNGNLLTGNILKFNNQAGISIQGTSNNLIYNNYFNNVVNVKSALIAGENLWNTTRSEGTNIVGGPYLGGNFWGKPDGKIYPRGVRDINLDGIFDSAYYIEGSESIDHLPLKESDSTVVTVSNNPDQIADFSSIQAAVDSSHPGDTILVYPGVYAEKVKIGVEDLAVVSASGSPSDTIIQAVSGPDDIFSVTADGVGINGFCIAGDINSPTSGIHLYEAQECRIENNEFFVSRGSLQNNPGFGICLDLSSKNVLDNNTLSYNNACILLRNSSENMLFNNRVSNSSYGIWLDSSMGNLLDSNTAENNNIGIYLKASSGNSVLNSLALNNTRSCVHLWNSSENMLNNNIASNSSNVCIILYNSTGNELSNNTVSYSSYGIWLDYSSNKNFLNGNRALYNNVGIYLKTSNECTLNNNTALNNSKHGVCLRDSIQNKLIDNTASYSDISIQTYNASMNTIEGSKASGSNYGMWLDSGSNNNRLIGNEAQNNKFGIYLRNSGNNVLTGNDASLNTLYGICLNSSRSNTLNTNKLVSNSKYGIYVLNSSYNTGYDNYLNNNRNLYYDSKSSANSWNVSKIPGTNIAGGAFLGGNYWASPDGNGFSQKNMDTNYDGICDTVYNMGKGNIDYLPLAGSF
ncbi:NosD domain-containing protein [Methanosarcina hadiensis]|uniref:NosD domain-containing protein n=1 Tax=Methanosarcina hadiensis TaxID=3078083 RepID=UPI00397725FA